MNSLSVTISTSTFYKKNTQTKEGEKVHLETNILSQFQLKMQIKTLNANKI